MMTKNSNIQVRIAEDKKEQAKILFRRYGLTTSAAVNLFIERAIEENRIPFKLDPGDSDSRRS